MLQAKFGGGGGAKTKVKKNDTKPGGGGGGGGGHKLSVKVLTLNLYPMVSGGITPYLAVRFLKHHILHDDVFDKRETLRNSSL